MKLFKATANLSEGRAQEKQLVRCRNCGHEEKHDGVIGDCRFMITTYSEWVKCPCPVFQPDDSAEAQVHQELDEIIYKVREAASGSYPKVHSLTWLAGWLMVNGSDKLLLKPLYHIYRTAAVSARRERN